MWGTRKRYSLLYFPVKITEFIWNSSAFKGVLLCSFTKSWFCFGGVLKHALMLGGSKIALFFTLFTLLQYLSPQPDTNDSISSRFDKAPAFRKTKCVVIGWLFQCVVIGEQFRRRLSTAPPLAKTVSFFNIAISIQTSRILNRRIVQNLCTYGYCKTYESGNVIVFGLNQVLDGMPTA